MLLRVSDPTSLEAAIRSDHYSDYIYMYPPRQAYRRLLASKEVLVESVKRSLAAKNDINLYIHIPFCAQICRFCNLYTTSIHDVSIYEQYIARVLREAESHMEYGLIPHNVRWQTLYLGGGTPSALPLATLERLVSGLRTCFSITQIEETAIEVAPETITGEYLIGLRSLGFDRVSMGLQSTSAREVRSIGRSYPLSKQADITRKMMELGFRNVCLDLIFGLPGQDELSWRTSVQAVLNMNPHTICCYQWTSRPHTGFDRMGFEKPSGSLLRTLYHIACSELEEAGYIQETHVRWARAGGGYLQKQYHWGLGTVLGLGAGARSYLWERDLRNGYSIQDRHVTLSTYLSSQGLGWPMFLEGFEMSDDERIRKAVVLGLHYLRRRWFRETFGKDVMSIFGREIKTLHLRGLVEITDEVIALTRKGMAYRDEIVQLFFSDRVRRLTLGWNYDE